MPTATTELIPTFTTTAAAAAAVTKHPVLIQVFDDEGVARPDTYTLPDTLPAWAMDLATHQSTFQRTAVYRCLHCAGEHEEYRQNPRNLPYAKVCNSALEDAEGNLTTCTAPALRRVTLPGEGVPLNARRFEPLVIYERANYTVDQLARGLNRYYIPGRNNEPTEPGMKRIELTDIHSYNRVQKEISGWETNLMSARRETHREYFQEQRKKVRDDVNARFSQSSRYLGLRQLMRARSDRKSAERYGKALNANFHAQLLEFNQGNMQDWCAEDSGGRKGWQSNRAR
jgi:hypothetical protein